MEDEKWDHQGATPTKQFKSYSGQFSAFTFCAHALPQADLYSHHHLLNPQELHAQAQVLGLSTHHSHSNILVLD